MNNKNCISPKTYEGYLDVDCYFGIRLYDKVDGEFIFNIGAELEDQNLVNEKIKITIEKVID